MKKIKRIAPLFVALLILFFLLANIDREALRRGLENCRWWILVWGIVPLLLAHLLSVFRWKLLVESVSAELPFFDALQVYCANLSIAKWTPAYSGDFLRALYVRDKIPAVQGVAIIFLESLIDVATLLAIVLVGALIGGYALFAWIATLGLTGLFVSVLFLTSRFALSIPILAKHIGTVREVFRFFVDSPRVVMSVFFVTFLAWAQLTIFIKILFVSFGHPNVSLLYIFSVQPLITLLALLPVTMGGLGTREGGMLFFYATLAPSPIVLLVSLVYSTTTLIIFPLIGVMIGYRKFKVLFHGSSEITQG